MSSLLEPYHHERFHLRNRIIKSGIYEGRCDPAGFPTEAYSDFYESFARNEVGGIVTGFAYITREGRAMQPLQAGIDHKEKLPGFRKVTEAVHRHNCPIFLQIAHTGRQTLSRSTGASVRGCSSKPSVYFRSKPIPYSTGEVYQVAREFAEAAFLAKEAGFDGIQLHAAHGYLIHQFLLPAINNRTDEFGIDPKTGIGSAFFEKVVNAVREQCGEEFPVLVKISGGVDLKPGFTRQHFEELVKFLDRMRVAAIEISYGTMDYALNIFRGDVPESLILSKNPIFGSDSSLRKTVNKIIIHQYFKTKLKPFTPHYNLENASIAKTLTQIPVISVGGFRTRQEMEEAVLSGKTDIVGLARPFLSDPDLIQQIKIKGSFESRCNNCNLCSVMCDSMQATRCYKFKSSYNGTHQQNSFHHQPEC